MRVVITAFFALIAGIVFPTWYARAEYVAADIYGERVDISNDVLFASGITVDVDVIYIRSSLRMWNQADMNADIFVCDDCDFIIRNSGDFHGRIHIGAGAEMTQVVRDASDITFLDVNAPYTVLAVGAHDLVWRDLSALSAGAGELVLCDSSVVFSSAAADVMRSGGAFPNVVMHGVVTLRLGDDFVIDDAAPVMRNVTGAASIVIDGAAPGPLHAFAADVSNGDLYVRRVRETDYFKILGTEQGRNMNLVRQMNPDDGLLKRMDAAQTMDELRHIMSKSVAFHPSLLARPVQTIQKFIYDGATLNLHGTDFSVRPFYVTGNDTDAAGSVVQMIRKLRPGLNAAISVYSATAETDDGINNFATDMLGGNVAVDYDDGFVAFRALAGGTLADFDAAYIFDDTDIRDDARGASLYGKTDIGLRFGVITPHVGVEYVRAYVLNDVSDGLNLQAGLDVDFVMDGEIMRYGYKFTSGIDSASVMHAGIMIGVWSHDDAFGGDVGLNAIHDATGVSAMFSISLRGVF